MVSKGADVNAKTMRDSWTPLHFAAAMNRKEVAELLLTNNADVNAKDKQGRTPFSYAAAHGYKDVAGLLLANKAEVNDKDNYGNTPLHYAAENGQKDMVEWLRQHGGHE